MSTLDCVAADGENEKLHFLLPPVEGLCVRQFLEVSRRYLEATWGVQDQQLRDHPCVLHTTTTYHLLQ